jgi:hypothetical protein
MTTATPSDKVKALAKDLTRDYPRSPRETLGGYIIAARMLDKCRAVLAGTQGEYDFDCKLDNYFLSFSGINANEFKDFVATGASDEDVAKWIQAHAKQKDRTEIIVWNNTVRDRRLSEMEPQFQVFMEDYIAENLPKGAIVYHIFDIFDYEEKRL